MADKEKISNRQLLAAAKEAESEGDAGKAMTLYQQAVKSDPLQEQAWQRLMILHRKQKDYPGELKIIDLALKAYATHSQEVQQQWLLKNKKAAPLIKSLAKSLGLMNSSGGVMIDHNPILDKWNHRKEWVKARLKKKARK